MLVLIKVGCQDITEEYIERDLSNISLNRKLKVAWDPGNGAMGKVTRKITCVSALSPEPIFNFLVFSVSFVIYSSFTFG